MFLSHLPWEILTQAVSSGTERGYRRDRGTVEVLAGGGGSQQGVVRKPQSPVAFCGHIPKGLREFREREGSQGLGTNSVVHSLKTLVTLFFCL